MIVDGLRLGHETRDDAGERAELREVGQDGLDVVGALVVAELLLGVGVGDEEVHVGVGVRGVRGHLGPRRGELVAVADDEVDVLVDVGLGGGSGVGVGGVLLGLEHLPVGVLLDGSLEGLVVGLVRGRRCWQDHQRGRGTDDDRGCAWTWFFPSTVRARVRPLSLTPLLPGRAEGSADTRRHRVTERPVGLEPSDD